MGGACLLLLFMGSGNQALGTENYPGVHAGEDTLVFIQSADELGSFRGVLVLSYEYSMDWVITVSDMGILTESGLLMTDGHQYTFNADGTKLSEVEFTSLERIVVWDDLEFQVLPSYGYYLAPMVRGGLAYALVENKSGLPAQLVLASEVIDTGTHINLFEGFLYQMSDGVLTGQIAFTEVAFGNQGLVRGRFPENFPPPPENYPVPYPDYSMPGYSDPNGPAITDTGNYVSDPTLPEGAPVPEYAIIDRPHFTLEPLHDYDVPPISRIGIVAVQETAQINGYEDYCDTLIQEALGRIDGVETVYIPYDETLLGGAVIHDRAVWICDEYGVDALLMTELDELEFVGGEAAIRTSRVIRILVKFESRLLEGAGGSIFWSGEFESNQMHESYELDMDSDQALKSDIYRVIRSMVDDLVDTEILDGGHVD